MQSVRRPMLHIKLVCRSASLPSCSHHCYSTSTNTVNAYKILGIERNATDKQIKSAYYELSKKYHPDTAKSDGDTDKFLAITEAYAILSDENKRKLYDREMARTVREYTDEHWQPRGTSGGGEQASPNMQDASYFGKAYPGFGNHDFGDIDKDYRNFVAFQERLRKRRHKVSRTSHAPPEFWGEYAPGHQDRFESFYRPPVSARRQNSAAEQNSARLQHAEQDTPLKRAMPTYDQLHQRHHEHKRHRQQVIVSGGAVCLLFSVVIMLLIFARR